MLDIQMLDECRCGLQRAVQNELDEPVWVTMTVNMTELIITVRGQGWGAEHKVPLSIMLLFTGDMTKFIQARCEILKREAITFKKGS